jgi:molybdopterin synthase catalytic subunit
LPYNGPLIKLTSECLVPEPLIDIFYRDDCGAIVTFVGTIRNTSKDGNRVKSLKIDVYDNEAEERLITIASEAYQKWPLKKIAIHRRFGTLKVGEIALVVVIAAPRRVEAFEACQYIIDRIKDGDITTEKDIYSTADI